MQENRAPNPRERRLIIEAQLDDQVIHAVCPPKPLMACPAGKGHETVILALGRIIAPAIVRPKRQRGQPGTRRWSLIRAVEHAPDRPIADGGSVVALAFFCGGFNAAFSKRAAKGKPCAFKTPIGKGSKAACQFRLPGLLFASGYRANYAATDDQRQEVAGSGPLRALRDFRDDGQETHPDRR